MDASDVRRGVDSARAAIRRAERVAVRAAGGGDGTGPAAAVVTSRHGRSPLRADSSTLRGRETILSSRKVLLLNRLGSDRFRTPTHPPSHGNDPFALTPS